MESIFAPVALVAGLIALTQFASRVQRRSALELHGPAATQLGLRLATSGFLSHQIAMSGAVRGFAVTVQSLAGQEGERLRVTVDGRAREAGGIPAVLELERQRPALAIFAGEDVLTGDPAFDREVRVGGGVDAALSVLGPRARAAFLGALGTHSSLRVANGELSVESFDTETKAVTALVRGAVDLAEKLTAPADGTLAALASRAVEDPLPGVRLHAFAAVASGDWGSGIVASTARRVLRDAHPELRLRAALSLGEEGVETLERIVRAPAPPQEHREGGRLWWEMPLPGDGHPEEALLEDATAHERRRARALAHLAARQPRERVLPLVREALRATGPLLVAALDALAAIGDASFEAEVAEAARSSIPEVVRAAVRALGTVGTAAAVPGLRALAEGGSTNRELRRAIQEAISRIHGRAPGAAAGQVSLAGAEQASGRVSLAADDGAGKIALADGTPGKR